MSLLRSASLLILVGLGSALPLAAQVPMRSSPNAGSLSPLKVQLRDYVVELQDTLNKVESIYARIVRAKGAGMTSVALSWGRQLSKNCRVGAAMAETSVQRVSAMKTDDPRGERAMAAFRAGLTSLTENLRACQRDDSVVMASTTPDLQRVEEIAATASAAISDYRQVRDGFLTLLGIDLLLAKRSTAPTR